MSRSEMMAAVRSKGTRPEMLVRKIVFSMGYRYRLHRKELPGKPDLVFCSKKKVIFIHGCFWHQHGCKGSHFPKTNADYWVPKLQRNKERDSCQINKLNEIGWKCLVIWECELKNINDLKDRIKLFLEDNSDCPPDQSASSTTPIYDGNE